MIKVENLTFNLAEFWVDPIFESEAVVDPSQQRQHKSMTKSVDEVHDEIRKTKLPLTWFM